MRWGDTHQIPGIPSQWLHLLNLGFPTFEMIMRPESHKVSERQIGKEQKQFPNNYSRQMVVMVEGFHARICWYLSLWNSFTDGAQIKNEMRRESPWKGKEEKLKFFSIFIFFQMLCFFCLFFFFQKFIFFCLFSSSKSSFFCICSIPNVLFPAFRDRALWCFPRCYCNSPACLMNNAPTTTPEYGFLCLVDFDILTGTEKLIEIACLDWWLETWPDCEW